MHWTTIIWYQKWCSKLYQDYFLLNCNLIWILPWLLSHRRKWKNNRKATTLHYETVRNNSKTFSRNILKQPAVLTISSMFFSEKYRCVNRRTYCCTVSSLLFFVWLGDLAIISKVIFTILKHTMNHFGKKQNVWVCYRNMSRDQKTVPVSLEIVIGSRLTCETEREELSPKLIPNKMAAGGELTGRSFFNNYSSDSLNYFSYIHIVYRCALLLANFLMWERLIFLPEHQRSHVKTRNVLTLLTLIRPMNS